MLLCYAARQVLCTSQCDEKEYLIEANLDSLAYAVDDTEPDLSSFTYMTAFAGLCSLFQEVNVQNRTY